MVANLAESKDETDKPASLGSYARILSYGASHGGIYIMILGLVCAMASGIALPLMNIVFGQLVGNFNEYFIPGSGITEQSFKSSVNQDSLRASGALRLEYTQALFSLPMSKIDEMSVGTVTHAITALSNTIQQSVSDRLAILFQSLALLIAAYAIAFRYSWALTLVVSSAIVFVILGFSLTMPFLVKGQQNVDKADEKHAALAAEVFGSIRTVFALGAEQPLFKKYTRWVEEARKRGLRMSLVSGIHLAMLFFAMYVSFSLAFWFGLKLYREGHIANINTVITVFFSVLLVVTILGGIAGPLMAISKAISASGAFFGVIDSKRDDPPGIRDPELSHADIVFQNVTFSYPTRPEMTVLKGFHATFERNKTTALVGPSGSGKSTIVAMIERWYQLQSDEEEEETTSGHIHVGAHNINDLDVKWWRSQIGLVQQEPFLFNDTIYNNVAFGLIGSPWENDIEAVKMELITAACKQAFADEFIDRLPMGYSTAVGEGGITLSGGQRQRIAIARSIVSQPQILILDEATSSIDIQGEKIVQAALDRVSKDRTTIMIAHRLSTVRRADKIIVMKDGQNFEEGSHQELIHKQGIYHSLVHAQQLAPLTDLLDAGVSGSISSQKEEVTAQDYTTKEGGDPNSQDTPELEKGFGFFHSFGVLIYENRSHWLLYALTLIGAVGAGSGFSLQSWLFARLVQVFQFTGEKLVSAANFWALMFFILALAMATFYFMLGFSSNSISMFVVSNARMDYFYNLLSKPVSYYDREENSSGSLISRLSTDSKQLQEMFGPTGVFPLISIFNIIGCVAISFAFGWKLAAVTFFAAMPFLFLSAFMRIRYEIKFETLNAAVYADSSKFATEAVRAFRTVTALTMEDAILQRYSNLLKDQRQKAIRKAWYATLIFAFSDSVELCAMALAFWYGGQLLASHEYDPVAFFVVYIAIIQGGQSAGQFFSFGPNIAQAKASANRILAARRPTVGQLEQVPTGPLISSDHTPSPSVELQNLSFQYSSREVPTFVNLNLSIESGQFIAFVGPSGCGKSTLVSLLERFYDCTQGTILFGGRDIRSIELPSYRSALSLVAQEPKLFEGTIRENLLLGLEAPNNPTTEDQMIQACKDAEIYDFIVSLPDGFLTELGVNAQASLSGGQKQRLCIARALIRKPLLLLLDEATSSLDSQSESLVQSAMERLASKRNMTIIAVAHRLATIQKADAIFVFGEGPSGQGSRILESGTHHELLRRKGAYWQMCQAQALDR
ncbi:ABC transporter, integral membrane type 1 [Penicillium expansum]|uniref:ABC transporter, integral membrane type 1 n=1 Tax=Penicillium expansum TaxID=27334 RepID=A0A0A2JTF6_PENEN|nr:ABC transporter, integral membrane type 1 [Penicillium expansum]KGO45772.1 ABC transporter, integral membrane type 1 [Penicillium expansum]KGO57958.1 ABC transporter, integral membrane type 1 [Penicillium expansum]